MENGANWQKDAGLLVLRSTALFLLLTFGRQKAMDFVSFLRSGQPLGSFDFTQFLRGLGFPAPGFLAICAILNETVIACLISLGFLCRLCAAIAAFGMAVALLVSLRLGEEPFRAQLYCVAFGVLVITGPGRFSFDHYLKSGRARAKGRDISATQDR